MTVLIISSSIILTVFFIITVVNIFWGPNLSQRHALTTFPKVNVLIPARNEEKNIGKCLDSMLDQIYPDYKIFVLDDQSEDKTSAIVSEKSRQSDKIKLISGQPLPAGWLGKNWACHQLSEQADGEILIFCDADTWHDKYALQNTVGWMQHYKLDALSAFSQQIMVRLSERLMVPWIDLILYMLLPLWTVYLFPSAALSAANGQWIAFSKKSYKRLKGHVSVKNEVVEDVALFRKAKEDKLRVMTLTGTGMVYCRMYVNFKQIWSGFTKILYGLTGNRFPVFLVFLIFIVSAFLFPMAGLMISASAQMFMYLISFALLIRFIASWQFKHPVIEAVLLHPVSALLLTIMAVNSFIQARWGTVDWKGRSIVISKSRI